VDRSLLYRHRDLHAMVIARGAEPPAATSTGPAVSRASLLADLAGAHDRVSRLARENTQLRRRLSEALGEQAWRESGLGGPDDIQTQQRRITDLEQCVVELRRPTSGHLVDHHPAEGGRHLCPDAGAVRHLDMFGTQCGWGSHAAIMAAGPPAAIAPR
jgi:hypothetical protein